eukprot:573719_1
MAHWCFILSVCVVRSSRFLLSNDWSALEWVDLDVQLPRASVWMAVASYNNSIFIFGGQGETDSFVNQAVKFDLLSLTITDLGMDYLPFGLDGTSKYYTQINHLFYAIDHVSNPSHIIGYNLITKHESNTKPMSQYVGLYGCLSSMDDLLFVIGGYDGVALSSTQIYNTSSQNWTIGPPMNKARRYHTCVVDWIDSVLYAIGGWSSTAASTVERISIHMMLLSEANTSWNYIQSLSEGVPAASSLMVPSTHQIFVFFGYSSAPLQIIDCDSGTTASLSEQSTMYGVAALFVSNTIYAFGGREGQETSTCQTMDLLATKNPTTGSTNPSADPTSNPTNPSTDPTDNPSANPSKDPTNNPSFNPISNPSSDPSTDPTNNPSFNPTSPTLYVSMITHTVTNTITIATSAANTPDITGIILSVFGGILCLVAGASIVAFFYLRKRAEQKENEQVIVREGEQVDQLSNIENGSAEEEEIIEIQKDTQTTTKSTTTTGTTNGDNHDNGEKAAVCDWETWRNEEVVEWLLSLQNGKFKQYVDAFVEQRVIGSDLNAIQKNDLMAFGMTVFSHRTEVFNAIQNLTSSEGKISAEAQLFTAGII